MAKISKTSSTVEAKSNDEVSGYFQRAGAFGHMAVMIIFYVILYTIFWVI
jgi:hypothetical protein